MRSCETCQRSLGYGTRCVYCGSLDPKRRAAAGKPLLVGCPACDRIVQCPPATIARCTYCGCQFVAGRDVAQPPRLGPLVDADPVARGDVAAVVAAMAAAPPCALVRRVLHARAELAELVPGEAEWVVRHLDAAVRWRPGPSSDLALPIALDDASTLVPRVVFGVADCATWSSGGELELLIVLASGPSNELERSVAINALGIASTFAFGVGFSVEPSGQAPSAPRIQVRVKVAPVDGGIRLAVANQRDQKPPTRLSDDQHHELTRRIANAGNLIVGYYVLAAILGTSCRATTAFTTIPNAIARRLAVLSCPCPARLLDALCIRMPPVFGAAGA